jgi:hypothetical protein
MSCARVLWLIACLIMPLAAGADSVADDVAERIAAHFEAASSRLRSGDSESLERFVSRVRNTPGAKLAVLIPITTEPARARFVAARVNELERRVQSLAETAEYRRIAVNTNADVLWLALVLEPRGDDEAKSVVGPAPSQLTEVATTNPPQALTAPATPPVTEPRMAGPADLRLTDWVVRGVKRRAEGGVSAYVVRTAPGAVPREVFEHQVDRDLGLVKEISFSAEAGWAVRTEIGWIGQGSLSGGS